MATPGLSLGKTDRRLDSKSNYFFKKAAARACAFSRTFK